MERVLRDPTSWGAASRYESSGSTGTRSIVSIESELANRNSHAVGAQITKAKDSLAVSDHNHADILIRPMLHNLVNAAAVIWRDVESTRLTKDVRELLAGLTDCWRIDKGHHLIDIVEHEAMK